MIKHSTINSLLIYLFKYFCQKQVWISFKQISCIIFDWNYKNYW